MSESALETKYKKEYALTLNHQIKSDLDAADNHCLVNLADWYKAEKSSDLAEEIVNLIKSAKNISSDSAYLKRSLKDIPDPALLKDCAKSAALISDFIISQKKIVIYGDYDADGISSCAILARFFKNIGYQNFSVFIPDRFNEGYGVSKEARQKIINLRPDCLITVDSGVNAKEELNFYQQQNITTVVVDHHQPVKSKKPEGCVINPQQTDCPYPQKNLVAGAVCFLLMIEVRRRLRKLGFWQNKIKEPKLINYLDLVTIAVVADNAPMLGLNRLLVYHGLKKMNDWLTNPQKPRPFYFAVMFEHNYISQEIDTEDIAFKIAPLLNAAGRIKNAKMAFDFLTSSNKQAAFEYFKQLTYLNKTRRKYQEKIFKKAKDIVLADQKDNSALVVWDETFHEGLIGIVASKLVENFNKPAIVLAPAKNCWKGSGRCPKGFDLINILEKSSNKLLKFGGHKQATGLSIEKTDIPNFRKEFNQATIKANKNAALTTASTKADIEIMPWMATRKLYELVKMLGPFGIDNPCPIFLIKAVSLKSPIYKSKSINKWRLNKQVECLIFAEYKNEFSQGLWDLAGYLKMAYYKNYSYLQFVIQKTMPNKHHAQ